ncbi:MAG: hypothetical protein ABL883_00805 [Terricaulis sp.]
MANVTITMDEDTARWVRVEAAKAGKSVSRWVGEVLAGRRRAEADTAWEAGREARLKAGLAFLASPPRDLGLYGKGPTREEVYADVLYRHKHSVVREGHVGEFQTDDRKPLDRGASAKKSRRSQRTKPA